MTARMFSTLAARVGAHAPGCPHPLLVQAIREAARRVCERALVWRYEQPVYPLTAGLYSYEFAKPADTEVQAVFSATLNDAPLDLLTLERAVAQFPKWAVKSTTPDDIAANGSQPCAMAQVDRHSYVVLPAPDAATTYNIRMFYALKPSRTALEMDEAVLDDCETVIFHGALQQLLVTKGTAWFDKDIAGYHAKQFLSLTMELKAQANLGVFRGPLVMQFPPGT